MSRLKRLIPVVLAVVDTNYRVESRGTLVLVLKVRELSNSPASPTTHSASRFFSAGSVLTSGSACGHAIGVPKLEHV